MGQLQISFRYAGREAAWGAIGISAYLTECFEAAAAFLTPEMRRAALSMQQGEKCDAEEFRMRAGRPFSVVFPGGEQVLSKDGSVTARSPITVASSDIVTAFELATQSSAHTAMESAKNGYVTVRGGHRVGICGTAVVKDGEVVSIKKLSSMSIRIAKQITGSGDEVLDRIICRGAPSNTLIISPPGCGKTTLLRDIVRQLSDGTRNGGKGLRVSVADERGEIAALWNAAPQFDVGGRTDILECCPKAKAVMILLRAMSPQVIAVDEITAPEDLAAVETAANCGVRLLATLHADSLDDLRSRPLSRRLVDMRLFQNAVLISNRGGKRSYGVYPISDE